MESVRRAILLLAVAMLLPLLASACAGEIAPSDGEEGKLSEDAVAGAPIEGESREAAPSPLGPEEVAGPSAAGASLQLAGASIDRKIIQTASLSLQVKAVGEAFQEVGRIAAAAGGFVASSSFSTVEENGKEH